MVIQAVGFDVVCVPTHHVRMTNTNESAKQPQKPSSARHTRAIRRDRSKRPDAAPPDDRPATDRDHLSCDTGPSCFLSPVWSAGTGTEPAGHGRIGREHGLASDRYGQRTGQDGAHRRLAVGGPMPANRPCRSDCARFQPFCCCACS